MKYTDMSFLTDDEKTIKYFIERDGDYNDEIIAPVIVPEKLLELFTEELKKQKLNKSESSKKRKGSSNKRKSPFLIN
jgi:hypothetical protein